MSEQRASGPASALEELARQQKAQPVADIHDLRLDVWDSEEELEAFLADWRASRNASIA